MHSSLESDRNARRRIVSEIGTNFFVEAGAGSGKTTMLVRRMVAMVEAGVPISKICAITFTRAAAGEFYNRFQKMLMDRSNPDMRWETGEEAGQLPAPTAETRERCHEALQNIDLCFMGTIDSFCGMLLSEHPTEAGVPSDATILSDENAETIYRQQYVKICGGQYGEELQQLAKTFQLLHRNAQDVFQQGLSFLMNNRNVRFHYDERSNVRIDQQFAGERKQLLAAIRFLMDHPNLKYPKEQKNLKTWENLPGSFQNIRGRWSSNFGNVLYGLKELKNLRVLPGAVQENDDMLGPLFVPGGKKGDWYELGAAQEGGLLDQLKKLQYDVSMTFMTRCIPILEQALREKSGMTYFDFLYYLRNMLRKDAEKDGKLIRYIYNRHSYFLIDEFQDTNPLQAEVFFYLSAENPVPQWSACVPRPGSLFIVGDPKQSIYRFRSADVTSFLRVKRLFERSGGAVLALSRNFRSVSTLSEYYNRVFKVLLPEETENQSKYEEIPVPDTKPDEFQGVFTYKAFAEGKSAEEHSDETDPVRIADLIEALVDNSGFQLRGEHDTEPRPIRYSDFMVITYGKKKLRPILEELASRGIPTRVEGDVPFAENEALREISRIYSAVTDPKDEVALYGALTGKLIGSSYQEILRYKDFGGSVSLRNAQKSELHDRPELTRLEEELVKLRELSSLARKLSPAALFTKIMECYQVYRKLPADNLEVVCYTQELLRNAEKTGMVITMKDGSTFLQGLIAGESGQERCLSLEAEKDWVHMANLHKVKGLEAPIVILAGASSRTFTADNRMVHGEKGADGYLFTVGGERNGNGKSQTYFETKDFPDEKAAENEALKAEGQRLVYVAATRARNALILCNRTKVYKGKESIDSKWKPITEDGTPDIFWFLKENSVQERKAKTEALPAVDAALLYEQAEAGSALKDRTAQKATFRTETPSGLHLVSRIDDAETVETEPEQGNASGEKHEYKRFPALLGTMTHKLMEMMVSSGNRMNYESAISEIIREYRTAETEPFEPELKEALTKVATRIRNGGYEQTNGLPKDILTTLLQADAVYCEVPFCYQDEEQNILWNGIMDVIYAENGRWHIVDYKTNADGSDLDIKYQGQLAAYIQAFRKITGETADARTYHIDI